MARSYEVESSDDSDKRLICLYSTDGKDRDPLVKVEKWSKDGKYAVFSKICDPSNEKKFIGVYDTDEQAERGIETYLKGVVGEDVKDYNGEQKRRRSELEEQLSRIEEIDEELAIRNLYSQNL